MIYTSYFSNIRNLPSDVVTIGIARFPPKWYKGLNYTALAPTPDMLGTGRRSYVSKFAKILGELDPLRTIDHLNTLSRGKDVVLLCYEKYNPSMESAVVVKGNYTAIQEIEYNFPKSFCHRYLVSRWLNNAGIQCKELTTTNSMIYVTFTGTREGMTPKQKQELKQFLIENKDRILRVHHGGCKGADEEFHAACLAVGIEGPDRLHVWPGHPERDPTGTSWQSDNLGGNYTVHTPMPYLTRNRVMVRTSDVVIGTPKSMQYTRGGTWYTIRYSQELEKEVNILEP